MLKCARHFSAHFKRFSKFNNENTAVDDKQKACSECGNFFMRPPDCCFTATCFYDRSVLHTQPLILVVHAHYSIPRAAGAMLAACCFCIFICATLRPCIFQEWRHCFDTAEARCNKCSARCKHICDARTSACNNKKLPAHAAPAHCAKSCC